MRSIERIEGQVLAKGILGGALRTHRIAPAYLFSGPEGTGKVSAALQFARALNCESGGCKECPSCVRIGKRAHPDVRVISVEPDKTEISINQMRAVQGEAYLKPFMARVKVYIIEDAERMSEEAANSLLKTLEEPPGQAFFILTTSSSRMLLSTITSRCQTIRFLRSTGLCSDELLKRGRGIVSLLESSSVRPLLNLKQKVKDRDEVIQIVDALSAWYRDVLLLKEGAGEEPSYKGEVQRLQRCGQYLSTDSIICILQLILQARYKLVRNVNPRLVIESLMLELHSSMNKAGETDG